MKSSNKRLVPITLVLVLGVVSISGCVQIGEEGGPDRFGNGLVISSFEAIPQNVFSGDDFDLILDVKNKGGHEAKDVAAYLYSTGTVEPDAPFQSVSNSLSPPTEEIGGEMDTVTWTLTAPDLRGGVTDTLNPRVRVYYKYRTTGRVKMPVMSKSEFKRRKVRDESIPSIEQTTVSRGPLSVEISGQSPSLVEQGEKTFRVYITADNLLKGTAYHTSGHPTEDSPTVAEKDLGEIEMMVQSTGASLKDCSEYDGKFADISIRRGENIRKSCEFSVDGIKPMQEIPITVTFSYGYFLSDRTSVTVKGE